MRTEGMAIAYLNKFDGMSRVVAGEKLQVRIAIRTKKREDGVSGPLVMLQFLGTIYSTKLTTADLCDSLRTGLRVFFEYFDDVVPLGDIYAHLAQLQRQALGIRCVAYSVVHPQRSTLRCDVYPYHFRSRKKLAELFL